MFNRFRPESWRVKACHAGAGPDLTTRADHRPVTGSLFGSAIDPSTLIEPKYSARTPSRAHGTIET